MYKIEKDFYFHAAHRNTQLVGDKCFNLHGHTYHCKAVFEFEEDKKKANGVTILFSELGAVVDMVAKQLDHKLLGYKEDSVIKVLQEYTSMEIVLFDYETTAENLAKFIFESIAMKNGAIKEVHLKETTTSNVIYKL